MVSPSKAQQRILNGLLGGFICILPVFFALLLVSQLFHANLFQFIPFHNDELGYWRQILTYTHYAFRGGYYNIQEQPAPASFTPFGEHGPLFIMIYGTFGRVLGWPLYAAPFINIFFLVASFAVYLGLTRPPIRQLPLLGLAWGTFWAVVYFIPSNMQESFHQAAALLFAGLFYMLLSRPNQGGKALQGLALALILLMGVTRFTWLLLLLPLAFILLRDQPLPRLLLGLGISAALIPVLAWGIMQLYAPYPDEFLSNLLLRFSVSLRWGFSTLYHYSLNNMIHWFQLGDKDPYLGPLQRYQVLLLALVLLGACLRVLKQNRWKLLSAARLAPFLFAAALILFPILAAQLLFYDLGELREFRVLAPFLLLTLFLIFTTQQRWVKLLVGLLILTNILYAPLAIKDFQYFHYGNFHYFLPGLTRFGEKARSVLEYRPNADPWCNTLLTDNYMPELIGLPAGIGISYVMVPDQIQVPIHSRYLLVESRFAYLWARKLHGRIIEVAKTNIGDFFINLDAKCPPARIKTP
jgi:hypothetical protein